MERRFQVNDTVLLVPRLDAAGNQTGERDRYVEGDNTLTESYLRRCGVDVERLLRLGSLIDLGSDEKGVAVVGVGESVSLINTPNEDLPSLTVVDLKEIAAQMGLPLPTGAKKADIVDTIIDARDEQTPTEE